MSELRFHVLVRRRGKPVHSSDKYETETMSLEDMVNAFAEFIASEIELEAQRTEGEQ